LATWFGTGYAPVAPGTFGSLAALPVHWLLTGSSGAVRGLVIASICLIGVWSAGRVAAATGKTDPQIVVIDEVAGQLIALAFVQGLGFVPGIFAVLLFRAFDMLKPWPISALEGCRPAGVGIMADDIGAGLVAGVLSLAIVHLF
jgi:phosphatidylglycerophosphatase A